MSVRKTFTIFIILSIIGSFIFLGDRIDTESKMKNYNFVLDLEETVRLADDSGKDLEYWLSFFSKQGVGYAALTEETLYSLIEEGKGILGELAGEVIRNGSRYSDFPDEIKANIDNGNIDKYDLIITFYNDEIYEFVLNGIKNRYEEDFYKIYEGAFKYIVFDGVYDDTIYSTDIRHVDVTGEGLFNLKNPISSKLYFIGIDYDMDKFQMIRESGMEVVLRPVNYERYSDKLAKNFVEILASKNPNQSFLLFYGKEMIGFPNGINTIWKYMEDNQISTVLIENSEQREHIVQKGAESLTEKLNYTAIRAFTMWDFVRERINYYNYTGAEEIENTLYRAITERNIRIVYFKPFLWNSNKFYLNEEEYERTFTSLTNRLSQHKMELGEPSTVAFSRISRSESFIMSLSIVLLAIYLLGKIIKIKKKYIVILSFLGVFASAGLIFLRPDLAKKIFSLMGAIIFSSWASYQMIWMSSKLIDKHNNIVSVLKTSLSITIVCFSIALIGAYVSTAFLSEPKYLLEMDIFRGVKFSQIIPIFSMAIFYVLFIYLREKESILQISKNIIMKDIKVLYVLIGGVLGLIGYIYISRTGHESNIQPMEIELIARNFFERALLARPRTKEFLIGFPSVFIFVYLVNKGYRLIAGIFSIGAVIGFSSMINTFSHIRTPLYLSTIRSGYGLFLGILIGATSSIVLEFLTRFYRKHKENKHNA